MSINNESTPLLLQRTPPRNRMSNTSATWWRIGAVYGAAAVCLGAFGAHGLKQRINDPAKIASWATAAHYQVRAAPAPHCAALRCDMADLSPPPARPFGCCPDRPRQPARGRALDSRHDHVQWKHLRPGSRPRPLQGPGASHPARWSLSDRGLALAGLGQGAFDGCRGA